MRKINIHPLALIFLIKLKFDLTHDKVNQFIAMHLSLKRIEKRVRLFISRKRL